MKKDYQYGGKKTAFNGVFMWLQGKELLKGDLNQMAKQTGNIVREFLIDNKMPVRLKNSFYDLDINCQTVQKNFQSFVIYVKNKYLTNKK